MNLNIIQMYRLHQQYSKIQMWEIKWISFFSLSSRLSKSSLNPQQTSFQADATELRHLYSSRLLPHNTGFISTNEISNSISIFCSMSVFLLFKSTRSTVWSTTARRTRGGKKSHGVKNRIEHDSQLSPPAELIRAKPVGHRSCKVVPLRRKIRSALVWKASYNLSVDW